MSGFAWITLTTNDNYAIGALVLGHSLKKVETVHQLVVLITPEVSNTMEKKLSDVYDIVEKVNVMDSCDTYNLVILKRPELGVTFTKLHCWKFIQFEKCVFLDADVLVVKNCDELFEREELSAAPDISWPDCFNSGVYVFRPNLDTFGKLMKFASENRSFDGADQGLLNQFFSDWSVSDIKKHLPFIYNTVSFAIYGYLPAFKQFGNNIKIIHFAGKFKPWSLYFNTETENVHVPQSLVHIEKFVKFWWGIYLKEVHQKLKIEMLELPSTPAEPLKFESSIMEDTIKSEEYLRKHAWEIGEADYSGKDSFEKIWEKICQTIAQKNIESTNK